MLPFDRVHLPSGEALSPDQFLALPLDQRIRFILRRELRFTKANATVDVPSALKALMAPR